MAQRVNKIHRKINKANLGVFDHIMLIRIIPKTFFDIQLRMSFFGIVDITLYHRGLISQTCFKPR